MKKTVLIRLKVKTIFLLFDKETVLIKLKTIAVPTRKKIKTILSQLDKKAFLKKQIFLIINYNNQELIHHVHCFGYIFCHQSKTTKFC